jgi:predicted nucleotidyltransferase
MAWLKMSGGRLLQRALAAALTCVPGVRVILFGSRAAGTGRPDSDYDLFIFPNQAEGWQCGQARVR